LDTRKKRIEWIDLAKGFCILLVMWWHIKELYSNRGFTDRNYLLYMGTYFRMPLYFFLSGLFFKTYSGYMDFLTRKTNKLLVPYLIFAFLGVAFSLLWQDRLPARRTWEDLYPFLPIWFLWCLFVMNSLFYAVRATARGYEPLVIAIVGIMGVAGYCSGESEVKLLHMRTAFTAMPFFVAGYAVRNHTNFLTRSARQWELIPAAVAATMLYILTRHNGKAGIFYISNTYEVPLWALYGGGVLGIYAILTVASIIKRLPMVSHLGRYSIVVLITHYPILYLMPKSWSRLLFKGFGGWCALEELVLLACIEIPIIALCTHYLPWFFAQKDLVKPHSKDEPIKDRPVGIDTVL
jgi:fucose 4-O-acetylase-like acetyltransferase